MENKWDKILDTLLDMISCALVQESIDTADQLIDMLGIFASARKMSE